MKVKTLRMQNFRGFEDVTLDFHDRVTVLIGENGAGKSSVLDCLAVMLSKIAGKMHQDERTINDLDIRNDSEKTENAVLVEHKNHQFGWRVIQKRLSKNEDESAIKRWKNLQDVVALASLLRENLLNNQPVSSFLYYPSNRSVNVSIEIPEKSIFDPISAWQTLESKIDYKEFFRWFRGREDIENEEKVKISRGDGEGLKPFVKSLEYKDAQLSVVRRTLKALFDNFNHPRVRRKTEEFVIEKDYKDYAFSQLSDGEKNIIVLICDITRRLAICNEDLKDPLEGTGIVMIDEIELHLHPSWQRMIIPKLTEIFPNLQFIVTTHSPQVLGEVENGKVYLLEHNSEKNSIEAFPQKYFYGLDSNRLLVEVFDDKERTDKISDKFDDLFDLIDEDKIEDAKKLRTELGELMGDEPIFVAADPLLNKKRSN